MQRQKKVRLRNLKTSRDGREKIKIKFKKASITTKKSIEKILKSTKEREGRVFMEEHIIYQRDTNRWIKTQTEVKAP